MNINTLQKIGATPTNCLVVDDEIWKPVPGFPGYQISNLGRITGRRVTILKLAYSKGYPHVTLYRGAERFNIRIHVAVCVAFHGPRPTPLHEAAHEDGKPANCRADNLSWKTNAENRADMIRHGTISIGSKNGNVIITEEIALAVRATYEPRKFGLQKTATLFGIGKRTVDQIVRRQTWRHI